MAALTRLLALALLVVLAFKAVVAQDLPSGEYMILSNVYSGVTVGSFYENNSPVILGGENNVWTIESKDDGSYIFTLRQAGYRLYPRSAGDHLLMSSAPEQQSLRWRVQKGDGNIYSIVAPGRMAWTAGFGPNSPVTLKEFSPSNPHQRWMFIQR